MSTKKHGQDFFLTPVLPPTAKSLIDALERTVSTLEALQQVITKIPSPLRGDTKGEHHEPNCKSRQNIKT